jgi:type II secretory pathway predicted ATPase ExeA
MLSDHNRSTEHDSKANSDACIHLVASRRQALESLQSAAFESSPRPVLITGEPGAGKTVLIHSFMVAAPTRWRIASVDLAAGMNALEFLRLAGHALGVSASSRLGKARLRIQDALADESTEDRRWVLLINEAHRGRSGVWDEVQAIANQLGRPRGFAALFIVGATDLARLLRSHRSSIALAAQIASHIHLKPIDLDEARELLEAVGAMMPAESLALEELHRSSRGNPAVLLRLAQRSVPGPLPSLGAVPGFRNELSVRGIGQSSVTRAAHPGDLDAEARPDLAHEVVKEETRSTRSTARGPGRAEAPALIPSKPPIRDEEGLVEVGWEGDLEDELSALETAPSDPASSLSYDSPPSEELIEDRYAALQTVSEREARLTRGAPAADTRDRSADYAVELDGKAEPAASGQSSTGASAPGGIRAEGQHEFAPYSQLFTRFRQSK